MNIGQNSKMNNKIQRIILFVLVFIICYLLLVTAIAPQKYSLKEGDIPRSDIKATRDIVDEKATKDKEDQALEKVGKQYTIKPEVKKQADDNIKALFDKLISLSSISGNSVTDKITELKKISSFQLSDDQCKVLLNMQGDGLADLEGKIVNIIDSVYEKNIVENDDGSLTEA